MKYNSNWLIERCAAGEKVEYLYFWGHQRAKDGSIGNGCFSQWWVAPVLVSGVAYNTAEHWMMSKKAELFGDTAIVPQILSAGSPKEVKQLGRQIKGFESVAWDAAKFDIVVEGNMHKFRQHEALREFLLSTGNSIIVEASPVDAIWGIGMAEDDKDIINPERWRGENLLGYALMTVRDALR